MGPASGFGEPGTPVPRVDPEDIKAVWTLQAELATQNPGKNFAVGGGALERTCKPGADIVALGYRDTILFLIQSLHPIELAACQKNGRFEGAAFRAAAEIPMEWMAAGVERQGYPVDIDDFLNRIRAGDPSDL